MLLLATCFFLGFGMAAKAQLTTNALFAGNNFGLTNQVWRYEQIANLDGTGWEQPGYNDSAWASGRALLAFEANTWVLPFRGTVLTDPRLANNPPAGHARYFRTHFTWTGSAVGGTLLFNARLDDGALIYLNGVEVYRLRPPANPITHASVGSALPCGGDADCGDDVFTVASPALVTGDNVLAVAVYQNATTSSDIVWGTGLAGVPGVAPSISNPAEPHDGTIVANRQTNLLVIAFGSPTPTYQWYKGGSPIDPSINATATNSSYVISNMMAGDTGNYFCRVANALGSVDSRTAVIGFSDDTNGPVLVEATGSSTFDRIVVQYNEFLEMVSAQDTFNYSILGPGATALGVLGATLNANGSSVTLMTDLQTPGTTYTITVNSVQDLAANSIAPDSTIEFRSWINTSCGGVLFEAYNTGGGNAVSVLTSHPTFPNSPDFRTIINTFDIRVAVDPLNPSFYNTDAREAYGGRLRGLFVAPESGPHTFFFASDDNGELWLSTDATPANKVRIARESGWSASKEWTTSGGGSILGVGGKRSAPINLQAGRAYYIEALYKEGGGGDNCAVAVQLPSQASPPVNGADAIPGSLLGATAVPPGITGPIIFSQQPANTAVDAPARATFSAVASASVAAFVCYQWQKAEAGVGDFNDIMGATGPTYITPSTSVAADNGDEYRVVASAISGSATSAAATLTVHIDVTRPTVVKVLATSATAVSVVYSEMMDAVAAVATANYALSGGIGVTAAAVNGGNPNRVDLTTTPMVIGTLYTLTMKGSGSGGTLADLSGNRINPDPATATFRAQTYNGNVDTIIGLPTTGKLPLGSLTSRGILVRLVQVASAIANDNAVTEQMLGGVYPSAGAPLPNIAPVQLYLESGMINYNKDGPTSMDGNLVPDAQFPGFGSMPLATLDNLAMEAVTYLELHQGIYRMVVRSDDGFRLTPALSAEDPGNSFIIGEYNGGRGTADTPLIDFFVTEEGLYPMRLIYEEGQGGAAVEWKIQDLETGNYFGVNGSPIVLAGGFPGGGPNGFQPPCSNKSLTMQRSGSNLIISWPKTAGGNLFQLQQANTLANPSSATVWSNVGVVPQTSGPNKTVTVPIALAKNFYRLFRPGPPCN